MTKVKDIEKEWSPQQAAWERHHRGQESPSRSCRGTLAGECHSPLRKGLDVPEIHLVNVCFLWLYFCQTVAFSVSLSSTSFVHLVSMLDPPNSVRKCSSAVRKTNLDIKGINNILCMRLYLQFGKLLKNSTHEYAANSSGGLCRHSHLCG